MKIDWTEIKINNENVKAKITIKQNGDERTLRSLFNLWLKLNKAIKAISTRGINLPEAISENAFCLFFDAVWIVKLSKGKCSFDCVEVKTGKRIQIKAISVKSDLTSFGPKSEWDELYFLDFSALDGSFKAYKIEPDWIYEHKVNKNNQYAHSEGLWA